MHLHTLFNAIGCWLQRICLKLLAGLKSGVYFVVNEHFQNKADAKRALSDLYYFYKNLYNKSYFEAARRSEKRSLLCRK